MSDLDRLAMLVHELRSPVAALIALEQTLSVAGSDLPEAELRRLLELGVAAGRDVERLLADPDLFSIRPRRVDVTDVVTGLRAANVEVEAQPGLIVNADPVRLRQALANLLANGLRHGSRVWIRAQEHGDDVWVTVSDDGPGVDPGIDAFAHGVTGAGSTGFGLYVARAVAEAHGGSLKLVSAQSEGASFRLALPRAAGASG